MNIQEFKNRMTLPIVVSPMFIVSGTKLVIECCKNGIVGTFPALNGRSSEDFEKMLIEVTTELDAFEKQTGVKPAPFGVNLIVNKTNPRVMPDLQLCVKYKVPLIITSLGAVKDLVDAVHSYGGLVFHDIVKKRHAEKAAEAGVDGLICVAAGAGGHAGTASPFALLSEIKSFFKGAVLLAGSIDTGNDVLAAQTMGADFAYMGTRFIATDECVASKEYKQMLVDSGIDDIIYTDGVSGVNANFLKPSIEKAGVDLSHKKEEDFSQLSGDNAKAWKDIWSAGHGTAGIDKVVSVKDLVSQLKQEYKAALEKNAQIQKNLKF
ncbi:nitronate monooxygenase [Myroides marinus]|uniref:NAD(P)H-dependent flavin oxidoreductase n=1 Tax=Myroides TaxID=76831 RepID=UPI00257584B9|nr:nitronate monooxygenase family protein [Myroides marinus]MDM1347273.1 nitronate monooxygenase [Myroides marinus]MDM1350257.1 nitronate monooxygenase [Myroides marinus]MDM1354061.1 nitronate monooxygenase [Myroides marinus]MDM1357464.1 nitronate monooxygenase [Myroides marinus]MDM1364133.1 nitronate monooxygenase [Myroides marinus]